MGRWSRAAAGSFLRWLDPPADARWLDVGCGTGILSEMALMTSAPAALVGIDRTPAQVAHAARHISDGRARFEVGDAQALPFTRESFDVVASGLVLNFVPEPQQAVTEMRRVVRPGGVVAAYVWDFEPELSPSGPLRRALKAMALDVAPLPGTQASGLPGLAALFERAGLADLVTTTIEVTVAFADFRDFWELADDVLQPDDEDGRRPERKRAGVADRTGAKAGIGPRHDSVCRTCECGESS